LTSLFSFSNIGELNIKSLEAKSISFSLVGPIEYSANFVIFVLSSNETFMFDFDLSDFNP